MGFRRPDPEPLDDGSEADPLPYCHLLIQLGFPFIEFLIPDIMPAKASKRTNLSYCGSLISTHNGQVRGGHSSSQIGKRTRRCRL